ncbi:MAG: 3-dehydroquinate synthase [Eubacteriales bacterium]
MSGKITLAHSKGSYDIITGRGLLKNCGELIRAVAPKSSSCLIVSDTNVFPLYGKVVSDSLTGAGFALSSHVISAGEENKTLDTVSRIYASLAANGITRTDIVLALGGGVVGDITGFAAATWLRGVDFVQLPTTLLAQIDSSIGGKTGVDTPFGKNLVGAFRQPLRVIADADTLDTLPSCELSGGMAEAIKYGCIADRALFADIADKKIPHDALIESCAGIKRDVVQSDEFEGGLRMILNFGHTIGHAIEKCMGFTGISHGQAVAIGMVYASRIGEGMGITKTGVTDEIVRANKAWGLPCATDIAPSELADAALSDKKRSGGEISLIILEDIGRCRIVRVKASELEGLIYKVRM